MKNIKCKNCKNLVNDWCDVKCDSPDTELVRNCIGFEQMTNASRIRAMSDEELAEWLKSFGSICEICSDNTFACDDETIACGRCVVGITNWLKQPAEVADET